jgi:23S rRNA (uracil1939-C5)-methyltransferase
MPVTDGTIVRLAGRGDGVTADGRHVPLTAPGDVVGEDGTIARGPHYAVPPCAHYPQCGGCQLQHIDAPSYSDFVADRVRHALVAQGIQGIAIETPHLSPPHTRRRAALKALRKGREVRLGFNEAGSHNLVDVRDCPVLHPALTALLKPLRLLLATMMKDRGSAEVQLTLLDQGVDVLLTKVEADGLEAAEAIGAFAAQHKLARLSLDEGYDVSARWEPEAATMTFDGVAVAFPQGAFLQATGDGEAALLAAVRSIVAGAGEVADLFAGLGTFALPLSAHAKVYAAEGARDPVLALTQAANRAKRSLTTEHRDLFRRPLTPTELARFDAVVLDPPRAGAREQVGELAASNVPRIAYVSCNPQTFARDAAVLIAGGYALSAVTPVGQFRWSTHVELVGAFIRR